MMNGGDLRRISDMEEMRGTNNCVKCGDVLSSFQQPRFISLENGKEQLQWICSNCSYRWFTPCKDAEA